MVDVTVSDNLAVKWLQETLADGSPVTYFTAEMVGDNWQMRRYARNIHAAQAAELEALRGEVEETAEIAEQDGYSKAVQDIDVRTGGDGEYYASMMPGRGCETPQAMMANIVERFSEKEATISQLRARVAALEEAAAKVLPFNVENGPDYASVYFGDGSTHSTQAMTMNPQDWLDLEAALRALLNQNGEA